MSPFWVKPSGLRPLPNITTANKGLDRDVSVAGIRHQVAGWATVITVDNRKNHQKWWHGGGRHRKEIFEIIRPVGLLFLTHGGKTGRAMIKYPPYKKNAQPYKRCLYPGLTTVSLDRIITYMKYYYVMCQKGRIIHRAYVQLDSESAEILHDHLEQHYDTCQVCDVKRSEVDPELVI